MRYVVAALAIVCVAACAPTPRYVPQIRTQQHERLEYDLALVQVERPAKTQQRYGPSHLSTSDSAGVTRYTFEDSLISVVIVPQRAVFAFRLTNQSPHSIKVVWDEAAYVDITGSTQRVMHAGVRYSERNASMPPSVIPRGGHLEDIIQPADNVYLLGSSWESRNLIPSDTYLFSQRDSVMAAAQSTKGRELRVLLPIEIEGVVNEYTFTFRVTDIRPVSVGAW